MRVILDTNIIISMVLGGKTGQINTAWRADKFRLLVSDDIISEYLNVLQRPKFHLAPHVIAAIINRIYRKAEFVKVSETLRVVDADPKDDKFLEAALAGHADCVVSGDNHLLALTDFREIPILTARAFLEQLARE